MILPTPEDALAAYDALNGLLNRTPVVRAEALDATAGTAVHAKLESLQQTGSFKVRGATNRLRTLPPDVLAGGLITVSAGNAALGAAHAARRYGARLTVVMPENAVPEKLAAVRAYGGVVVNEGITNGAVGFERAAQLSAEQGLTLVHPFDDPMVVAGAATATLELLDDVPSLTRLYVPCSGGGLLAGAVLAAQTRNHDVRIIGVQPVGAAGFVASLEAGTPTAPASISTVADGLTAPRPGGVPFAIVSAAGIEIQTVTDEQILDALTRIVAALRVVVEPSAAAGLAALLAEPEPPSGDVGLLVSGSNVNRALLADCLARPLS
ncbi:MAG: threonine dehydratase [Actinomycetota bacterium]|jgi:threonine dehydratase|nr:threonine dehydratase [Actinomycetota bacterium]